MGMDFDWDPVKSAKNLAERGFGFDYAALVFLGPVLSRVDDRTDYGEVRVNVIGDIEGVVYHVTFTDRDEIRWIISARRANKKERRLWLASLSNS
ncbi:BrnT family toxin [uncultured Methylobacterium sp.]|jgi:uncharacterized DUF497 family protein|uniref:BrnT family toxin n=1 Tax=uncultured Methylobacterium sp. TaxID=157278 RepID=UPI00260DDA57|nr:BrnT family toxin [uncultured Methylobacterium sp.]